MRRQLSVLACAAALGSVGDTAISAPVSTPPREQAPSACSDTNIEATQFVVCTYLPEESKLRILWRDNAGPIGDFNRLEQSLGPDVVRLRFAVNGGMYDPAQAPVGLLVQASKIVHRADARPGKGNFYLLPNGVFWIDAKGAPHITETKSFLAQKVVPIWATQSGPLLLRHGRPHPAIAENGPSLLIRNAVGICRGGTAKFLISTEPVSFGRLTKWFRDRGGCSDVLYLDGVVSSLWAPAHGNRYGGKGLGPIIVVSAKAR